jgi:hypothetical protein
LFCKLFVAENQISKYIFVSTICIKPGSSTYASITARWQRVCKLDICCSAGSWRNFEINSCFAVLDVGRGNLVVHEENLIDL